MRVCSWHKSHDFLAKKVKAPAVTEEWICWTDHLFKVNHVLLKALFWRQTETHRTAWKRLHLACKLSRADPRCCPGQLCSTVPCTEVHGIRYAAWTSTMYKHPSKNFNINKAHFFCKVWQTSFCHFELFEHSTQFIDVLYKEMVKLAENVHDQFVQLKSYENLHEGKLTSVVIQPSSKWKSLQ